MTPPADGNEFACRHCSKVFGRAQHVKRHELVHTRQRDFRCAVCSRTFLRRDALLRHELTHQASTPSLISKGRRACSSCAVAKTRCSGEDRCSRCQQRGLQCTYPHGDNRSGVDHGLMVDSPEDPINHNPTSSEPQASSASAQPSYHEGLDRLVDFGSAITYGRTPFGSEYWDPSILASSNWLDLVGETDEFPQTEFPLSYNGSGAYGTRIEAPAWSAATPNQPVLDNVYTTQTPSDRSGASIRTAVDLVASHQQTTDKRGDFYVDGEPARKPRIMTSTTLMRRHVHEVSRIRNFSLHAPLIDVGHLEHRLEIPATIYEELHTEWERLCIADRLLWPMFEQTDFPPLHVFEHCLALYFSHFHQTFPLLHAATFDPATAGWTLLLSMIALGARYLDADDEKVFMISLQEFLRRCLHRNREVSDHALDGSITTTQTYILHLVGQLYSGNERLVRCGLEQHRSVVVRAARSLVGQSPISSWSNGDSDWQTWLQRELHSRALYSAFVLDSMATYHFQERPMLSVNECPLPLPCGEDIWNDSFAEARRKDDGPAPTLLEALQEIYIDKRVPRDRGEFARVITVHGLFHRSLEVETYFSNPLSHWEPTAEKQSSADILPTNPIWPPSTTTFVKWQNSVCDCLDILHWQANATIGKARGLEHPTVAFLHLSRVVLLTPLKQIVRLAKATAAGKSIECAQDQRFLQLWAAQGQYKARLAAIHAGVVFWHIRRYSVNGFYEASTVALATVVLWAFGTFSNRERGQSQQTGTEETVPCNIILLDRPTDDELVQQFIRRGHQMKAYMDGVGDLYEAGASQRVLAEGCKLLRTLRCWGAARDWVEILESLENMYKST